MSKRLTQEEVIKRFIEVHGDRYNYSKFVYKNCKIKSIIVCNTCHNEFTQTYSDHFYKKVGCSNCNKKIGANKRIINIIKNKGSLLDNNPEL